MITKEDIARLHKLCAAATPGPWTAHEVRDHDDDPGDWHIAGPLMAGTNRSVDYTSPHYRGTVGFLWTGHTEWEASNAKFAAAAREWLPRLLDEVERCDKPGSYLTALLRESAGVPPEGGKWCCDSCRLRHETLLAAAKYVEATP